MLEYCIITHWVLIYLNRYILSEIVVHFMSNLFIFNLNFQTVMLIH